MTRAIGVDGAPRGWVSATIDSPGSAHSSLSLEFFDQLSGLVRATSEQDIIVIDMPIGLPDGAERPADQQARDRLGPRRSTFFPTPMRAMLRFDDWAQANDFSKAHSGKGLSKQAWNLLPKIAEVDDLWSAQLGQQLREGHPETSFAEMAGSPLMVKKSSPEGRRERLRLLNKQLGDHIEAAVESFPRKWQIDAVDSLALAWTATRIIAGNSITLGGEVDARGRPMELTI